MNTDVEWPFLSRRISIALSLLTIDKTDATRLRQASLSSLSLLFIIASVNDEWKVEKWIDRDRKRVE